MLPSVRPLNAPLSRSAALVAFLAAACLPLSPSQGTSPELPASTEANPTPGISNFAGDTTPIATSAISPLAEGIMAQANEAWLANNLEAAIDLYTQAIALVPEHAPVYNARGLAYDAMGQFPNALADFDTAIRLSPSSAEFYNNRGETLYRFGATDQALQDFSQAISLNPTYGLAYQNRALLQREKGQPFAALADLQVYLALAPDAPDREVIEEMIFDLQLLTRDFAADVEGRIFADDFSDFASGWFGFGDEKGLAYYTQGGYRITITDNDLAVWGNNTHWFADVRIEVDARKLGGPEDNLFGVMCRYVDRGNFYTLLISSDGYYGLGRRIADGPLEPVGGPYMLFSPHIRPGESSNHIRAECTSTRIALWVNGHKLIEVEDAGITAGLTGLFAATFSQPGTDILFDNFEVFSAEP